MSLAVLNPGDPVGEYRLEAPLGRGGFGQVWRAVHRLWGDRIVALKIPTDTHAIRRLTREAVLQSSLDHPGIARAIGLDASSDPPYIAMEYVEGESLRERLDRDGPIEPDRARELLLELVAVLDHAHGRGVVHQDIKPENLLIASNGQLKVTDFGLGTSATSDSLLLSYSLRSEEGVGGTLAYMAPEVRDGEPDIDARADLYSTGVVLF
ncbi:MAG: serine/threonine-protein kinase, partial [Planctomycetota bacterium]